MNNQKVERLKERLAVPAFNPAFVPVTISENTVHIRAGPHTGSVITITDEEGSNSLKSLVELIDGETPIEDILSEFDEDDQLQVLRLFEHLLDESVMFDASTTERPRTREYYTVKPQFEDSQRTRLEETDLLILSVGPMGEYVAEDVAELGVGSIRFCNPFDDDDGSVENVDAVTVVSASEIESCIKDCDAVVYLADRALPELTSRVNQITHETDTPWMVGQIQGFDGFVGPMIFPGNTACYNCFVERTLSNVEDPDMYRAGRNHANSSASAPLPPFARLVAGYVTLDLLHLLAFGQGFTAGRIIHVNGIDLSVEVDDVLKLPRCRVCGKEPGDDIGRFLDNEDIVRITKMTDIERREEP